jgi:hypothetical protein
LFAPPSSQSSDLVAGPDSLPAPAGRGPNALRLPAVRAVVSVIAEERPCDTKSTVVIVSKTVMLKVVRVKCVLRASTTDCADMISGEASTDTLSASAIAGKAATQMAGTATKAATASPAETATSKASPMAATHATTAEASSAVAAPTTHATTTPLKPPAPSRHRLPRREQAHRRQCLRSLAPARQRGSQPYANETSSSSITFQFDLLMLHTSSDRRESRVRWVLNRCRQLCRG